MTVPRHAALLLVLPILAACTEERRHPLDLFLSQLRQVTVVPLAGLERPAGTLLCPMSNYQSRLPDAEPAAQRVNDFLERKRFLGDEFRWSLVIVDPVRTGDDGIEHMLFKNARYTVVTDPEQLKEPWQQLPSGFAPQACVPVGRARVLAIRRHPTDLPMISFGTQQ